MTAEQDGLRRKFKVERVDPEAQERHRHCATFVLEPRHDHHARVAVIAYADSVKHENPDLYHDLMRMLVEEFWALDSEVRP